MRAEGLEPPRAEAQQVLSLSRLPVPPRPRVWFTGYPGGYTEPMSEQSPEEQKAEREAESRESDTTKYDEQREEQSAERERIAQELEEDPPLTAS
jgi:signal transduction histidine kinase